MTLKSHVRHLFFLLLVLPALLAHPLPANLTLPLQTRTTCPTLLSPDPPGIVRQQRIVGGTTASRDLRSYLAYIYNPITLRACTATRITPGWLVSAAHCNITSEHVAYLQGSRARQGTPHRIIRAIQHDSFKGNHASFDIALVEIERDPADRAEVMRVSVNGALPIPSTAARVLGYGSVAFDTPSQGVLFGALRQVDVPVNTHAECVRAYNTVNENFQVCAGYLGRGGCDSCQGDSGGPLIQYTMDDEPVLVGVVSRGLRCGEARYPGIYVRMGAFESWVDSVVGDGYIKAQETKAVLVITRSARETFQRLLLPIGLVCGGVLGVGFLIVAFVRWRRWRKREEEEDEESGSTDVTNDFEKWPARNEQAADARVVNGRNGRVVREEGSADVSDSDASFVSAGRVDLREGHGVK